MEVRLVDIVAALRMLEAFRQVWQDSPKGEVVEVEQDGQDVLMFLFQVHHYQVMLVVSVGPKLGITERCVVVDTTTKRADVDHLVFSKTCAYGPVSTKTFLQLSEDVWIARQSRDRGALRAVLKTWLMEEGDKLQSNQADCSRRLRAKTILDVVDPIAIRAAKRYA